MGSKLLEFYRGERPNPAGLTIYDIHDFSYEELEANHDYIQWMFPLPEPSLYSSSAPLLRVEDRAKLGEGKAWENLFKSLLIMVDFYQSNFNLLDTEDHNVMRITRIVRCLTLVGKDEYALAFCGLMIPLLTGEVEHTMWYWKEALKEVPA